MATHSSILAWRIPWTEEPGGLQSTGSQRVAHDCVTNTTTARSYRGCGEKQTRSPLLYSGTLLSVTRQPGWERSLGENGSVQTSG